MPGLPAAHRYTLPQREEPAAPHRSAAALEYFAAHTSAAAFALHTARPERHKAKRKEPDADTAPSAVYKAHTVRLAAAACTAGKPALSAAYRDILCMAAAQPDGAAAQTDSDTDPPERWGLSAPADRLQAQSAHRCPVPAPPPKRFRQVPFPRSTLLAASVPFFARSSWDPQGFVKKKNQIHRS